MPNTQPDGEYRPRLRPDILFGPILSYGERKACFFKDRGTGRYYRVGLREQFLLRRMDGTRTLAEIDQEYQARFGRSLGPKSWEQIFTLIGKRALLEGNVPGDDDAPGEAFKEMALPDGFFTKRFRIVNPNTRLDRLLPWFRFTFTSSFLYIGLAIVAVTEIWFLMHFRAVLDSGWGAARHAAWFVWPLLLALILFAAAIHEAAHGLTLRRYGLAVDEMGVIFRYFTFFPYTKIDDVVLLQRKRDQIAVAFSGTFVSLLFVVPFAAIWKGTPAGDGWHELSALMLTSYNFTGLLNLVPFVQLDGYHMTAFLAGRPLLRADAKQHLKDWARALLGKRPRPTEAYSFNDRAFLLSYALLAVGVSAVFMTVMVLRWYRKMAGWAGPEGSLLIMVGTVALWCAVYRYKWIRERLTRWLRSRSGIESGAAEEEEKTVNSVATGA